MQTRSFCKMHAAEWRSEPHHIAAFTLQGRVRTTGDQTIPVLPERPEVILLSQAADERTCCFGADLGEKRLSYAT